MGGRLTGKTAVITGAASGMGRATALLFAREGARVAVLDCDEEGGNETARLIKRCGGEAVFLRVDLAREQEVEAAIEGAVSEFGSLDILVNNAGIVVMAPAADTSFEDWEKVQAVNLRGGFLCCKYAIPQMRRQGGGAIVNIASIGALVAVPAHAAYDAAKAGLVGLTRAIAMDYGPHNIRANCVCPTATDTPLIRGAGAGNAALRALAQMHPLRRLTEPEDIAHAVLFLASDEARCITGVVLPVDSGWTVQ
jgi:NAD(P)-dependent dehydrogenase (short-subunit alcohol dehydrogenase family)